MKMNKYIEPTKEHEGQMVEVRDFNTESWKQRKLLAVLSKPQEVRFICEHDNGNKASWRSWVEARISVPKTYGELHAECGLKVGDWVKVLRKPTDSELDSFKVNWGSHAMDWAIGSMREITREFSTGFTIKGGTVVFPCFMLEKAEKPAPSDEIIHVPGTVEHWIYRGHAYRWATAGDTGKRILLYDDNILKTLQTRCFATMIAYQGNGSRFPFLVNQPVGAMWSRAIIQDDSLLKPVPPEPEYMYVEFGWEDRRILRGALIYRDCPGKSKIELRINKVELSRGGVLYFEGWEPSTLLRDWKFMKTNEPVGKKVVKPC